MTKTMQYLILIVITIAVFFGVNWYRKHGGKKEKVVSAKITGKRQAPHESRGREDVSLSTDCVVTFQVEQKSVSLVVNHSFYEKADAGMTGKLTYKGDVFVDFEIDDPRMHRMSNL